MKEKETIEALEILKKAYDSGQISPELYANAISTYMDSSYSPFAKHPEIEKGLIAGIKKTVGKVKNAIANKLVSPSSHSRDAHVGDIRTWNGKKMQKQEDGKWKEVSEGKDKKEEENKPGKTKTPDLSVHAKNTSTEDLKEFIKTNKDEKLVEIAKKELESRGIKEKSPEPENKQSGNGNQTVETDEEHAQRTGGKKQPESSGKEPEKSDETIDKHKERISKIDSKDKIDKYKEAVSKTTHLSDKQKKQIHKHLDEHGKKLQAEEHEKEFDKIVNGEEDQPKKVESKEELAKEGDKVQASDKEGEKGIDDKAAEKASEKEEKKPYDASKDPKAVTTDEGTYNPETGEGWEGDKSLGDKIKNESEEIDDKVKSDVTNLLSKHARKGAIAIQEGPGGLGKTFTAVQELEKAGYKRIELGDKSTRGDNSKKGYVHVSGSMTPAELYNTMHDYPHAFFLIDDARKILTDPEALEMLKAASDTSKNTVTRATARGQQDEIKKKDAERKLNALNEDLKDFNKDLAKRRPTDKDKKKQRDIENQIASKKDELEMYGESRKKEFDFGGKVLIISNSLPPRGSKIWDEFYGPLESRTTKGKVTDLNMSKEAKLYKLSTLIPHFDGGVDPESGKKIKPKDFKERKEIYDFVKELVQKNKMNDISTRILSGTLAQKRIAESEGKDWKKEVGDLYKAIEAFDIIAEGFNLGKIEPDVFLKACDNRDVIQKGFNSLVDFVDCFSCTVFRNPEDKILFLKRSPLSDFEPTKLCLPGGHIEIGESPYDAALRETSEEIHIDGVDIKLVEKINLERGGAIYYFENIQDFPENKNIILDEEHSNYMWLDRNEWMEADLMLDLREHLIEFEQRKALEDLSPKLAVIPEEKLQIEVQTPVESFDYGMTNAEYQNNLIRVEEFFDYPPEKEDQFYKEKILEINLLFDSLISYERKRFPTDWENRTSLIKNQMKGMGLLK